MSKYCHLEPSEAVMLYVKRDYVDARGQRHLVLQAEAPKGGPIPEVAFRLRGSQVLSMSYLHRVGRSASAKLSRLAAGRGKRLLRPQLAIELLQACGARNQSAVSNPERRLWIHLICCLPEFSWPAQVLALQDPSTKRIYDDMVTSTLAPDKFVRDITFGQSSEYHLSLLRHRGGLVGILAANILPLVPERANGWLRHQLVGQLMRRLTRSIMLWEASRASGYSDWNLRVAIGLVQRRSTYKELDKLWVAVQASGWDLPSVLLSRWLSASAVTQPVVQAGFGPSTFQASEPK